MIMSPFHQNQSPPISGLGVCVSVGEKGVRGEEGGRARQARPPAGRKDGVGGERMDSIPGNPLGRERCRAGSTEWPACF